MKLFASLLFAASLAAAQSTVTFGENLNTGRIAQSVSLGFPLPPIPFVEVFIGDNLQNGTTAYLVVAQYQNFITGVSAQASVLCLASTQASDQQGTISTYCPVYINAQDGLTVVAYPLIKSGTVIPVPILSK